MTKSLVFYTNPQSRGMVVHWMLEEIGAPYSIGVWCKLPNTGELRCASH